MSAVFVSTLRFVLTRLYGTQLWVHTYTTDSFLPETVKNDDDGPALWWGSALKRNGFFLGPCYTPCIALYVFLPWVRRLCSFMDFSFLSPSGNKREKIFNKRETDSPDRETVGRLWPSHPPAWVAGKAFEWSPRCFQRWARCLSEVQTGRAHRGPATIKYTLQINTQKESVHHHWHIFRKLSCYLIFSDDQ